jgi:hypothetical protein
MADTDLDVMMVHGLGQDLTTEVYAGFSCSWSRSLRELFLDEILVQNES